MARLQIAFDLLSPSGCLWSRDVNAALLHIWSSIKTCGAFVVFVHLCGSLGNGEMTMATKKLERDARTVRETMEAQTLGQVTRAAELDP